MPLPSLFSVSAISASLAFPFVSESSMPFMSNSYKSGFCHIFTLLTHQVFCQDFQSSSFSIFPTSPPPQTGHPKGSFISPVLFFTCSDFMSKPLSSSLFSPVYKLPLAIFFLEDFSRTLILCQFLMRSILSQRPNWSWSLVTLFGWTLQVLN